MLDEAVNFDWWLTKAAWSLQRAWQRYPSYSYHMDSYEKRFLFFFSNGNPQNIRADESYFFHAKQIITYIYANQGHALKHKHTQPPVHVIKCPLWSFNEFQHSRVGANMADWSSTGQLSHVFRVSANTPVQPISAPSSNFMFNPATHNENCDQALCHADRLAPAGWEDGFKLMLYW